MLPDPLTRLVEQLQKLPGIGAKSAQRLAFHVLKNPREDAERLCEAIRDVKDRVTYCSNCNNITDADPWLFLTRPISGALIALSVASLAFSIWQHYRHRAKLSDEVDADF